MKVAIGLSWVHGVGLLVAGFATWDVATASNVTFSSGNLVVTNTGTTSNNQGAHVDFAGARNSNKFYFETTVTTFIAGGAVGIGIGKTTATISGMSVNAANGVVVYCASGQIWAATANTGFSLGARATGNVIGIAVDLDNYKLWCRVAPSGNWNGSGTADPVANVGGVTIPVGSLVPFCVFGGSGGVANNVFTANFGGSAYTGAVPTGFGAGWV